MVVNSPLKSKEETSHRCVVGWKTEALVSFLLCFIYVISTAATSKKAFPGGSFSYGSAHKDNHLSTGPPEGAC